MAALRGRFFFYEKKMRSTVIIKKRGEGYIATVCGKFGGGFHGARCGLTAQDAAIRAAELMVQYAQSNNEGCDLVAPQEIIALMPKHLLSIDAK